MPSAYIEIVTDWHRNGLILKLETQQGLASTPFAQKMHERHRAELWNFDHFPQERNRLNMYNKTYNQYFGFSESPFTGSNPEAYYSSVAQGAAFECLWQGLTENHGILLLTGEPGSGKSTLLQHLGTELSHCLNLSGNGLTVTGLIRRLASALGLSLNVDSPGLTVQALISAIAGLRRRPRWVLALDDAQWLPGQTIEAIWALAQSTSAGRPLMAVVLCGPPALEKRLRKEQDPRAKRLRQCHLDKLQSDEVIPYIEARLQVAGASPHTLFTEDALQKIAGRAEGIPRLVNLICHQALLLAYLKSERKITAGLIRPLPRHVLYQSTSPESLSAPFDSPPELHRQPRLDDATSGGRETAPVLRAASGGKAYLKRDSLMEVEPLNTQWVGGKAEPTLTPHSLDGEPGALSVASIPTIVTPHDTTSSHRRGGGKSWFLAMLLVLLLIISSGILAWRFVTPQHLQQLTEWVQSFRDRWTTAEAPARQEVSPPSDTRDPSPPEKDTTGEKTAQTTSDERIPTLLDQAKQQMADYRYIDPQGNNALESYQAILRLDPDNIDAKLGIERIKAGFLLWWKYAEERGDLDKAREHLEAALEVDPNDAKVRQHLDELSARSGETASPEAQ